MKKQFIAALMVVGFGLSAGIASAATGTAFTGNEPVTGGNAGDCTLLSEDITLGVSSKVHGAWACDETLNLVQVATCHEGGSRAQGAACVDLDPVAADAQLPPGCSEVGGFSTIPDYKAFFTSSQGGVTQEYALGGRCDASSIVGIDGF